MIFKTPRPVFWKETVLLEDVRMYENPWFLNLGNLELNNGLLIPSIVTETQACCETKSFNAEGLKGKWSHLKGKWSRR